MYNLLTLLVIICVRFCWINVGDELQLVQCHNNQCFFCFLKMEMKLCYEFCDPTVIFEFVFKYCTHIHHTLWTRLVHHIWSMVFRFHYTQFRANNQISPQFESILWPRSITFLFSSFINISFLQCNSDTTRQHKSIWTYFFYRLFTYIQQKFAIKISSHEIKMDFHGTHKTKRNAILKLLQRWKPVTRIQTYIHPHTHIHETKNKRLVSRSQRTMRLEKQSPQ